MDPVQAFLQANALTPPAFAATSRYYGIPTSQLVQADGRTVVFVQRRFLPPPENFATIQTLTLAAGQRPDQLAAQYLGVAEQWWRLADANGAMQPEAMTAVPGSSLRITLPEGVPPPPFEA